MLVVVAKHTSIFYTQNSKSLPNNACSFGRGFTFGEAKPQYFESLKSRYWLVGDTKVEELYEYKNLGACS